MGLKTKRKTKRPSGRTRSKPRSNPAPAMADGSKKARAAVSPKRPAKPRAVARTRSKPGLWSEAEIEEAFRRLRAANPDPRGELHHTDPFTLLVAVVLSAQATDAGVNKATPALFALANTPEKMVALGEEKVRQLIKTIGLYRTKAKNVVALSERLVAEHGGTVPAAREALEADVLTVALAEGPAPAVEVQEGSGRLALRRDDAQQDRPLRAGDL